MNNGPDCTEAKDPVDAYCEDAYPCEIDGLRAMDTGYGGFTTSELCLMGGYTIISQRALHELIEENCRLERKVRELEKVFHI